MKHPLRGLYWHIRYDILALAITVVIDSVFILDTGRFQSIPQIEGFIVSRFQTVTEKKPNYLFIIMKQQDSFII